MNKSTYVLRPSNDWFSVKVDTGWPETWERSHCGECDAPWWTLELRDDCWVLWNLPSRAAYDHGTKSYFDSAVEAVNWVYMHGEMCKH